MGAEDPRHVFPAVLHDRELAFVFVVLLVYAGRIPYVLERERERETARARAREREREREYISANLVLSRRKRTCVSLSLYIQHFLFLSHTCDLSWPRH